MATDPITKATTTPKSVSNPAGRVDARDASDLIQADRYLAQKAARASATQGVIFSKLIPAAAVPDQQGTNAGDASGNFDQPGN